MIKLLVSRRARLIGVAAASTALAALGAVTPAPAGADPIAKSAYVGVGSDTTQDVFNALAGAAPYSVPSTGGTVKGFDPIISSAASGSKGIVSWDAQDPAGQTCIAPKYNFSVIDRPNGSGDGQKALSRAIDGGAWTKSLGCGSAAGNVTGAIDFARSSSGPPSAFPGTTLSFIPFARDGLTYAYVAHAGADLSALTTTELRALYGTANVASTGKILNLRGTGHDVFACMVQSGSGTGRFWDTAMGNNGSGATASASAAASGCGSSFQENGYNAWAASTFISTLTATQDAVIPFSAGAWISQANGVTVDQSSNGRTGGDKLGAIDNTPAITGAAPNEAPNPTFYASTTYGRDLYVVVQTSRVPAIGGDAGLKSLFRGATSAICSASAQTSINKFGFSSATAKPCGTTGDSTLQSGLVF